MSIYCLGLYGLLDVNLEIRFGDGGDTGDEVLNVDQSTYTHVVYNLQYSPVLGIEAPMLPGLNLMCKFEASVLGTCNNQEPPPARPHAHTHTERYTHIRRFIPDSV